MRWDVILKEGQPEGDLPESRVLTMWAADAVGMWSIPLPQRPAGQAYLVVAMHLLGDVPSPPLVGALQGAAIPAFTPFLN